MKVLQVKQLFSWPMHVNLFFVLLALNLIDYKTTELLLNHSKIYFEFNPILDAAIRQAGGVWAIFLVKAIPFAALWLGFILTHHIKPYMLYIMLTACIIYTIIVIRSLLACQELGLI